MIQKGIKFDDVIKHNVYSCTASISTSFSNRTSTSTIADTSDTTTAAAATSSDPDSNKARRCASFGTKALSGSRGKARTCTISGGKARTCAISGGKARGEVYPRTQALPGFLSKTVCGSGGH